MPLSNATLHAALCAQPDTTDVVINAHEWFKTMLVYASESVPALANPALAEPLMHATVETALATLPPLAFEAALQTSLISFWSQLIPVALPGQVAILAPPTLAGSLTAAMLAALMCPSRASAMVPVSLAIHSWTSTILYGTAVTGPVTPLM